ncbi:hypothetical protein AB0K93_33615, partial [Streptomyces sp. NPDC052676]
NRLVEPVVLTSPHTDGAPFEPLPAGPVAVLFPYKAWKTVLYAAQRTGRHLGVCTRTKPAQLVPQFAMLPARDIRFDAAPRPGLPPAEMLRALR